MNKPDRPKQGLPRLAKGLACLVSLWLASCGGASVNPPAPQNLTYGHNPAIYTLGRSITANTPAWSGGSIAAFAVSPTLPIGLVLDSGTGALSGTPTVLAPAAAYTVMGTGPGGSSQAVLSLAVVDVPPSISYGSGGYTFTTGQAISSLVPANTGGTVVSWSMVPILPAGLVFSAQDGTLSGTPTAISALATYVITATNSGGSSSVSPQITVHPPPPVITIQPADASVDAGTAAGFSVTASGTGVIDYQWWMQDAPISGASGSTYSSAPLGSENNGAAIWVVVSDAYGGSCTSATVHVTVRPELSSWLMAHPRVAAALRWQFRPANLANSYQAPADSDKLDWAHWSSSQQDDLNQAYLAAKAWLAQGASQVAMDPAGLTDQPANQHPQISNDSLSPMEWVTPAYFWKLYVAHVAFSLALEITHPLPWSLADDSDETLRYLLDGSVMAWLLPNGNFGMGTYGGANLPALRANTRPQTTFAPPMWTYPWLRQAGLIGSTRQETIGKVMDWMRDNLWHFYGTDTLGTYNAVWQYRGYVPLSKIVEGTVDANNPTLGAQHWTAGCHGSVGFLHAVLRVLNIPVQPIWVSGHELAYFVSEKLYLDHGDDPYNANVRAAPNSPILSLLIDESTYQSWFIPDLTVNITDPYSPAKNNVGRRANEFK